jgi:UTP--glucose-1-phosphate uridylyltransferase
MDNLLQFQTKMRTEGLAENVITTFSEYYRLLAAGATGKLSSSDISPPAKERLQYYDTLGPGKDSILERLVVIKLNGGLGTSMGLTKAKSLLPVRGELTFLDIIAKQILFLKQKTGKHIQLLFMDSFVTQDDTLSYLTKYPELNIPGIPLDFIQNKYPRIRQTDLKPLELKEDSQNWNPPGHGDIYSVLYSSGLLDSLLEKGIRYAFIANSDNLGAVVDTKILTWMADNHIPFIMEICERTEMDKKGGHLAEADSGRLLLREIAQCPEDEINEFQDIKLYSYFNTNNLWIDLQALHYIMQTQAGVLLLPLIINPKTVEGEKVYQLETAMGAAINTFEGSMALVVPRTRFSPVKKTNDLLALWSDVYQLNEEYQMVLHPSLSETPYIELDENFFGHLNQMQDRIDSNIPSLLECQSLSIHGDVRFGKNVKCKGKVVIRVDHPILLEERVLEGNILV